MDATPTEVVNVAGPLLIGYLLSWGLYGTLSVQVYIYYLAFPNDRLACKILVYGVHLIETLQAILVCHDAFASFVRGFDNFEVLTDMHFVWLTMPVLSGIVAFFVQLFYAFRVMTLSKSKVLSSFIALLAVTQVTGALVSGIEGIREGNLLRLTSRLEYVSHGVFDITSGACDIVIAISMAFYLSRLDSGSVKSTHAIVSKIIRLVVGTGALTAAVAIIDISLYYSGTGKPTAWFLPPVILLGRLYSNSMMVIFNSRVEIVGGRSRTTTVELNSGLACFQPSEPSTVILTNSDRTSGDGRGVLSESKHRLG